MQVKLTFNLLDRPNDTGNLVLAHLDMRESAFSVPWTRLVAPAPSVSVSAVPS